MIDELLRFGQERTVNAYPQQLAALIDECVTEASPRAAVRGVRVRVAAGDGVIGVDKNKIKQALGNILDNAIEASAMGAGVDVTASVDAAGARIEIRDHGTGVPEAVRARLFTPFCTTKADGAGLGLALARELVEAHGGAIEWRPAKPGTLFVVTLPRTSDAVTSRRGRASCS